MWTLQSLLRCGTSIKQAEYMLHSGLMQQRTFDWFCLFADWCAPRFSGTAGYRQERFYNRCGREAYEHRLARVKRLHDRIACGIVTVSRGF